MKEKGGKKDKKKQRGDASGTVGVNDFVVRLN